MLDTFLQNHHIHLQNHTLSVAYPIFLVKSLTLFWIEAIEALKHSKSEFFLVVLLVVTNANFSTAVKHFSSAKLPLLFIIFVVILSSKFFSIFAGIFKLF